MQMTNLNCVQYEKHTTIWKYNSIVIYAVSCDFIVSVHLENAFTATYIGAENSIFYFFLL